MITPQQFDPLAGTTGYDSTAAITAAIAATPSGGKLYIPGTASGYLVSNGFTITQPINIDGDGDATLFTGNLPANTDLFHLAIPADTVVRDFSFTKMQFTVNNARSWFNIDTTAAPGTYLAGLRIADILAPISPIYFGIWANGLANGAGLSQAEFERCQLTVDGPAPKACFNLQNVGDSIRIKDGLMTGTGYGLALAQVSGAGSFSLDGTNITSLGGIVVQSAIEPIFQNFEIELATSNLLTGSGMSGYCVTGAGIFLDACDGGSIGPGQIQALSGCNNFYEAIYLDNTRNVAIDAMRFSSEVGGLALNISASASSTRIGMNNAFLGFGSPIIADNGYATNYASAT